MKTKKDYVTAIIPVYNGEIYIEETIKSILEQEYQKIELIIINDGSKDSSEKKINKIMQKSNFNIKYIFQENQGLMKTLNNALLNIDTEYVMILGQDDLIDKTHVCILLKEFKKNNNIGMVFSDAKYITNNKKTDIKVRGKKIPKQLGVNIQKDYLKLSSWNFIVSTGIIIKTEVIKKAKGFEVEYANKGEWLTWLKISNISSIGFSDNIFSFYRLHENNITNTMFSSAEAKSQLHYNNYVQKFAFSNNKYKNSYSLLVLSKGIIKNFLYYQYKKYISSSSKSRSKVSKIN